jgi:hypothetical protein
MVKSAAKGHHQGGGELELIDNIVSTAKVAADRFVQVAHGLIDAVPVEQAAADMRMLSATMGAPGVEEASEGDGPDAGSVKRGVENQFLEAAGAPLTGPAQAETMATEMLRTYKAERIKAFDTPSEQAESVQSALKDPAKKEIPAAEERTGMAQDVRADKSERQRASDVGNGNDL